MDRSPRLMTETEMSGMEIVNEEALKKISGFKRGEDYVEVICGCTSRKYGDSIGKLRVYATGQFVIACECTPHCKEEKLSPEEFEKHAEREGPRKWKSNIWVMIEDVKKVALWRTGLIKYYKRGSNININVGKGKGARRCKRKAHRDEFLKCEKCDKLRRIRLRTKEDCRIYHDVLAKKRSWICADSRYDKIICNEEEERDSRKNCRGCPRLPKCQGCTFCVCFGCPKCRFLDCDCRTCVDFMQNAQP